MPFSAFAFSVADQKRLQTWTGEGTVQLDCDCSGIIQFVPVYAALLFLSNAFLGDYCDSCRNAGGIWLGIQAGQTDFVSAERSDGITVS